MGALLESGMVGNIGLKHLRVIKEDTIKKWDDLGFLEGLNGHQKDNIAQLYENQASYLINEAAVSDASGSFETVVFPIIRRVFSKLLANDIVSVQAMNLPIGKLFYFVPKIGERDANGNHKKPYGIPNGDNDVANGDFDGGRNLYDRFYEEGDGADEGLFDYSKGKYTVQTLAGKKFVTFENGLATDSDTLAAGTYSSVIIKVDGFDKRGSGKISGPNGNEMDTEEFLASLEISHAGINGGIKLPFNVVTQKYGNGIVEYGAKGTGNTGEYPDIVDKDGVIYLQVDMKHIQRRQVLQLK